MQVYRGMDVGTAKPNLLERRGVTHHMIDIAEPEDEFSVAEFRRKGRAVIEDSSDPLIISGGSGLHFRALVDPMSFAPTDSALRRDLEEREIAELVEELTGFDSEAAAHVDLSNKRRVVRAVEIFRLSGETPSRRAGSAEAEDLRRYKPEVEFSAVGVDPGELLDQRVDSRLASMRAGGLVEEVRRLLPRLGRTAALAVGYREIVEFLRGDLTEAEAFAAIAANSKKLAKKQRTWFQRDPRVKWVPWVEDPEKRVERVLDVLR